MSVVTVRSIESQDRLPWTELFAGEDGYLEFYHTKLPVEIVDKTFERFLDPNTQMWAAVAVNDSTNEIVGFANYVSQDHTWDVTPKIYLNDLFVKPDARLNNIGRKLIQFVYDHADEMGISKVYWMTQMSNHRAQILYNKIGENSGMVVYERPLK